MECGAERRSCCSGCEMLRCFQGCVYVSSSAGLKGRVHLCLRQRCTRHLSGDVGFHLDPELVLVVVEVVMVVSCCLDL